MNPEFAHKSVMVDEIVEQFERVPNGVLIDATVGAGGHAVRLLEANASLKVLGIDRDASAVAAASQALAPFGDRAVVRNGTFDQLSELAEEAFPGVPVVGVLFDLGVSSHQINTAERGFSYRARGPLDMRMDQSAMLSAEEIVNTYDEITLADLLQEGGEERFARRIARAIVVARPISDTEVLAEVVRNAIPAPARRRPGDPAKRAFQALRIAVNAELPLLETALETALDLVVSGGRIVTLAYHSGEDRLIKSRFLTAATGDCTCPPALPCVCGAQSVARLITRGSRKPSTEEMERNPRSQSARLRSIELVDNGVSQVGGAE